MLGATTTSTVLSVGGEYAYLNTSARDRDRAVRVRIDREGVADLVQAVSSRRTSNQPRLVVYTHNDRVGDSEVELDPTVDHTFLDPDGRLGRDLVVLIEVFTTGSRQAQPGPDVQAVVRQGRLVLVQERVINHHRNTIDRRWEARQVDVGRRSCTDAGLPVQGATHGCDDRSLELCSEDELGGDTTIVDVRPDRAELVGERDEVREGEIREATNRDVSRARLQTRRRVAGQIIDEDRRSGQPTVGYSEDNTFGHDGLTPDRVGCYVEGILSTEYFWCRDRGSNPDTPKGVRF